MGPLSIWGGRLPPEPRWVGWNASTGTIYGWLGLPSLYIYLGTIDGRRPPIFLWGTRLIYLSGRGPLSISLREPLDFCREAPSTIYNWARTAATKPYGLWFSILFQPNLYSIWKKNKTGSRFDQNLSPRKYRKGPPTICYPIHHSVQCTRIKNG